MSRRYFGTDGVRGPYGGPVVNDDFARDLALAAVAFLREKQGDDFKRALVGRDTRASGESLSAAMIYALVESGIEAYDVGVVPTPAVAGAMGRLGAGLGIMITASHNPASDNGIKFFAEAGRKLTDEEELQIEGWLGRPPSTGSGRGLMKRSAVSGGYIAQMRKILAPESLNGWKIVVDAANGATALTTPEVLSALGADLELLGILPDGENINDGVGSQHPELMAGVVKRTGAVLGIAHDGDGDRVVLCDETGSLLDGDDILAILGLHGLREGSLPNKTVVATIQSNLGLDRALEAAGGRVVRTSVGDRYVVEEMVRGGFALGGESSGHIVLLEHATTGDGLATALKVVEVMQATGEPLSKLRRCWTKFPQVSGSFRVGKKVPVEKLSGLSGAIAEAESALGNRGRVLVRYSGTEPILRFLVEGEDSGRNEELLESLRAAAAGESELN